MNDTTRGELREQVGGELVIAYTIGSDRKETDFTDTADRIIALVTAARDAEIRDLLLSDSTTLRVEATVSYMDGHRDRDIAVGAIGAALDHIGLHGDGTGGQG